MLPLVGGKGANLGELVRIEGVPVPDGFCVTTAACGECFGQAPSLASLVRRLTPLKAAERENVRALCDEIRRTIEAVRIPEDLSAAIGRHLSRLGDKCAYAVRSSATAEDLATASFAGQHDTFLNIIGLEEILGHIRRCWASLFTERAVIYRMQGGFDHGKVRLAVVVQKMVFPQTAGILFTADPVTGNRRISSIDAGFGLGEALVSGLVNCDVYKVRDGQIIGKNIPAKKRAIHALEGGGTREREIEPERQNQQVLTDDQILLLEALGRKIEGHFGRPQDIEWCRVEEGFRIVQSRPITTLFPIPEADDGKNHVYVSVGHQQMMTDPMRPLGLSFFLLTTRAPMRTAGGRLFVDVTPMLASPATRKLILDTLGKSDPLIKDALQSVVERGDFLPAPPKEDRPPDPAGSGRGPVLLGQDSLVKYDPDPEIVAGLVRRSQASLEELERTLDTKSGPDLFDFILEDLQELKRILTDPQSLGVIVAAMDAALWINEKVGEWLGERNAADTLSQSVSGNVTSEMGLALMEVADVIRPYPEAVAYLRQAKDIGFLEGLSKVEGGSEARSAIQGFLDRYGMRCVGEIDITRTRWSEQPTTLVPLILSNIRNFGPGAGRGKFERGRLEASEKEKEILLRLVGLPEGTRKAEETKRRIGLIRTFAGYREYPKYAMVNRYFAYKRALLKEAEGLVRAGVLREPEDIHYLAFEEFREVVRQGKADYALIDGRKNEHRDYEKLKPPRVITSDGEIFAGKYRRGDLPSGALAGLPVSAGVVAGRARVILRMEDAHLEEGDILVTAFTDPSWTPLFVAIKGLVTEAGGLMTHGAVIAREYGLPAVVGVENATRLIKDGQLIRVHGGEGFVEII